MANARGRNSNTFRQGLNTDMHPLDTAKDVMTDNANATLITSEGNEYILQNMRGNELITSLTEGFKPIAIKVFNNIAYIISQNIADPTIGEIGTFPSPDWIELNKQIPVTKELMVPIATTSTLITPVIPVTIPFTRTKVTVRNFSGTWKTANQVAAFPLGDEGCAVCGWALRMTDSTYRGWWSPGASFNFNETFTGNQAISIGIASGQRLKASFGISCNCNDPSLNYALGSLDWFDYPNGTITNTQQDTVTYTYVFDHQGVAYIELDFTGSGVQGTIQASTANGIINATTTVVGQPTFTPVNGLIVDNTTGIIRFKILGSNPYGGANSSFKIISNINHTANPVGVQTINAWVLGPQSNEMVKTYDILALGLTGLQLGQATFSLYHKNTYPVPNLVNPNIQYKVSSIPPGVSPTTYQPLVLPPGDEVIVGISAIAGADTLDFYILYPGIGFFGSNFPEQYDLYITYPSDEGEILVPMEDVYRPLHNFYDYEGLYYDSAELPPPLPVTNEKLDIEGYYVAPLRTPSFNFTDVNFVDIELQPSYDRSMNIIFTDATNKPRLVNSRFIVQAGNKQATIANRQGVRDTNIYSNERWGNVDLILTPETVAALDFKGFENGGNLQPGGYKFYFVYSNSDLQTTSVFAESSLVQVVQGTGFTTRGGNPDERIGKTAYFQLSELDNKFLYVKVFYARDIGEFNSGSYELREVFNLYPIRTDGTIDIRITGFELTIERSQDYLEVIFTDISTATTLSAVQGSLAIANTEISLEYLSYLRGIASNLKIEEGVESMATLDPSDSSKSTGQKRVPYGDPNNVYHRLGYWSGETYELGIVFKMATSNLQSPVIPIRGIDNFDGAATYIGSGIIPGTGFDELTLDRENTNGVYRTQESKIVMDGNGLYPNNPNITYLKININLLLNDPFLLEITDGFFFVRKQRLKDCWYEGMVGATMAVSLSQPIVNNPTIRFFGTTSGLGSMENANGDFFCADNNDNVGTALKRNTIPCRYIPWMGSVGSVVWPSYNSTTSNPDYDGRNLMFTGNPYDTGSIIPAANSVWSHFSFYTPDIVTAPTEVASFFSNTERGLRIAENRTYINSANQSAFGSYNSSRAYLFQSTYSDYGSLPGVLSTFNMANYALGPMRWSYVTAGQDTVTPETFAGIVQQYEYMGNQPSPIPLPSPYGWRRQTSLDSVRGAGIPPELFPDAGRMNYKFDDYVGFQVEGGDGAPNDPGILKDRMQHEFTISGVIDTALPIENQLDLTAYYNGIVQNKQTMGVLARAYATSQGPLTKGTQWQAKYQSTTTTGYFAISKRYSWARAQDEFPTGEMRLFGGDCYIGEHFKRLSYKLGIPEDPAATDGSIYGDQAAGLEPAGVIMGMVLSSSDNFAIRSEQFKSASETLIFGTPRSFYPLYSMGDIPSRQQLDSKLYYAGYGLEAAALTKARQAVELPSILDIFPYRVLISAPGDLTSFTNGYRDFTGLNFRDYDSAFGQITKIITLQSKLFVIWEHGIGRIFTQEKTMVTDEDGGVYVDQASRLHPQAQVVSNKYGTVDPYSIVTSADSIYGIDWTNNKVWQLDASGGFAIISDFKIDRLLAFVKTSLQGNNVVHKFHVGYDAYKRNVYFNYGGYSNGIPTPIGSVYYNEILKVWLSKLTFYPYFIFNIRENWYSYDFNDLNPLTAGQIWQHDSDINPFCNYYGTQHPFEYEFILVDNPAAQKILNNLKIISTEEYPIQATYSIVNKHDYETNNIREISFVDRLIKRYKKITATMLPVAAGSPFLIFSSDPGIIAGEQVVVAFETKYEVQDVYFYLGNYYVYVVYQDLITSQLIGTTSQAYDGTENVTINNGIIKENILYKEDHFYIVVGSKFIYVTQEGVDGVEGNIPIGTPSTATYFLDSNDPNAFEDIRNNDMATLLSSISVHFSDLNINNLPVLFGGETAVTSIGFYTRGTPDRIIGEADMSRPRDKYIRIKLSYTGNKQVFIQAVESLFTYSFS